MKLTKSLTAFFISGLMLTSCNSNYINKGFNINFNLGKFIKNNFYDREVNKEKEYYQNTASSYYYDAGIDKETTLNTTYERYGILIYESTDSVKIMSMPFHKEIAYINSTSPSYSVKYTPYIGAIISYLDNNTFKVYDLYGNELLLIQYNKDTNLDIYSGKVDDTIYLCLTYGDFNKLFTYDSLTEVTSVKSDSSKSKNIISYLKNQTKYEAGNYSGLKDEQYFTLNTYDPGKENIKVYDKNDNVISYINLSSYPNGNFLGIFAGKLYYQTKFELPERTEEYDYYDRGSKYYLDTFSIDVLTGEKEEYDCNYLLSKFQINYKDSKDHYGYSQTKITEITENKILSNNSKEVFVDENLNIVASSVSELDDFEILNNGNYFNTSSKLLYDKNFNIIKDFSNYNVTIIPNFEYFLAKNSSEQVLMSLDGKEIATFALDTQFLVSSARDNIINYIDNQQLYKYDVKNHSSSFVRSVSNGYEGLINHFFYTMSPNNRTVYVSNNKESKSIEANQKITSVAQFSFESELCAYYIVKANIVNTETIQEEPYKYLVFTYKK